MKVIEKQSCPTCGQSVNERQIALFTEMVDALWSVWQWCQEKGRYEFSRKDIKHLLKTDSQIARFGDWVLFGGLLYRPDGKKGLYGLHKERVRAFFCGELQIPRIIWKNPLTNELKRDEYSFISQIPHLGKFLDENAEYIAMYREPQQKLF